MLIGSHYYYGIITSFKCCNFSVQHVCRYTGCTQVGKPDKFNLKQSSGYISKYVECVSAARGLVFLGGGPLNLDGWTQLLI